MVEGHVVRRAEADVCVETGCFILWVEVWCEVKGFPHRATWSKYRKQMKAAAFVSTIKKSTVQMLWREIIYNGDICYYLFQWTEVSLPERNKMLLQWTWQEQNPFMKWVSKSFLKKWITGHFFIVIYYSNNEIIANESPVTVGVTCRYTCGTTLSNTTNDHGSVSKEYRKAAASFATLTGWGPIFYR